MLDTSFVRENFDAVRSRLSTRNFDPAVLDGFLALDLERRSLVRERDDLNAATNRISKEVGSLMREGRRDEAELQKGESKKIAERGRLVETRLAEIESGFRETLEVVPNLPHASVPIGKDESANTEVRRVGTPRDFTLEGFEPRDHVDLGSRKSGPRACNKNYGCAICRAQGHWRAARARSHQLHARPSHAGTRLSRDASAIHCECSDPLRYRAASKVRG